MLDTIVIYLNMSFILVVFVNAGFFFVVKKQKNNVWKNNVRRNFENVEWINSRKWNSNDFDH